MEEGGPRGGDARREASFVLAGVHFKRQAELAQIVDAGDAAALFLGHAQDGQEHGGEDPDDGDHHQQFDECECGSGPRLLSCPLHHGATFGVSSPNFNQTIDARGRRARP
jgi:hypothetical protein